jgi:hypothetical protein
MQQARNSWLYDTQSKAYVSMSDDLIFGLLEEMKQENVGELAGKKAKKMNTAEANTKKKPLAKKQVLKKTFFGDTRLWDDEYELDEDEEEELVACSQAGKLGRHRYVLDENDASMWSSKLMMEAQRWRAMSGLASKFKELAGDICAYAKKVFALLYQCFGVRVVLCGACT